jgi:hypothetical protein
MEKDKKNKEIIEKSPNQRINFERLANLGLNEVRLAQTRLNPSGPKGFRGFPPKKRFSWSVSHVTDGRFHCLLAECFPISGVIAHARRSGGTDTGRLDTTSARRRLHTVPVWSGRRPYLFRSSSNSIPFNSRAKDGTRYVCLRARVYMERRHVRYGVRVGCCVQRHGRGFIASMRFDRSSCDGNTQWHRRLPCSCS